MSKAKYFIPAILYYGFIFFLSAQSNIRIGIDFLLFDKILHTALYLGFGLCLSYGLTKIEPEGTSRQHVLRLLGLGIVLGGLDEIHQFFVPGRNADLWDAVVDVLGVWLGWIIFRRLKQTSLGKRFLRF